jgi:hypothetical protein
MSLELLHHRMRRDYTGYNDLDFVVGQRKALRQDQQRVWSTETISMHALTTSEPGMHNQRTPKKYDSYLIHINSYLDKGLF